MEHCQATFVSREFSRGSRDRGGMALLERMLSDIGRCDTPFCSPFDTATPVVPFRSFCSSILRGFRSTPAPGGCIVFVCVAAADFGACCRRMSRPRRGLQSVCHATKASKCVFLSPSSHSARERPTCRRVPIVLKLHYGLASFIPFTEI